MHLLCRWIGKSEGWKKTTLEKEEAYIKAFYPDLEEVKERLRNGEMIACSIKLFRLNEGYYDNRKGQEKKE